MLFLAGEGHGNCEKVRWTRRHPPMGRRGVTEYPKRNGGSENFRLHGRMKMYLLYDGFFSFAVVRQISIDTFLKAPLLLFVSLFLLQLLHRYNL